MCHSHPRLELRARHEVVDAVSGVAGGVCDGCMGREPRRGAAGGRHHGVATVRHGSSARQSRHGLDDALLLKRAGQLRVAPRCRRHRRTVPRRLHRVSADSLVDGRARGGAVQLGDPRHAGAAMDCPREKGGVSHHLLRELASLGDARVGEKRRREGDILRVRQRARGQGPMLGSRLRRCGLSGKTRAVPGGDGSPLRRQSGRCVHRHRQLWALGRGAHAHEQSGGR